MADMTHPQLTPLKGCQLHQSGNYCHFSAGPGFKKTISHSFKASRVILRNIFRFSLTSSTVSALNYVIKIGFRSSTKLGNKPQFSIKDHLVRITFQLIKPFKVSFTGVCHRSYWTSDRAACDCVSLRSGWTLLEEVRRSVWIPEEECLTDHYCSGGQFQI